MRSSHSPTVQYNEPMLHDEFAPRKPNAAWLHDWLIPAPYVDTDSSSASWAADAIYNVSHDNSEMRDVEFFFGGRTSTAIGPGRAQMGYCVLPPVAWRAHITHPRSRPPLRRHTRKEDAQGADGRFPLCRAMS